MTIKAIVLGTALTAVCTLPTCFAQDYTLVTTNHLNSLSTLSINGFCSDSILIQPLETCSGGDVVGQTPAGGTTTCTMSIEALATSCGLSCAVNVYPNTGCGGDVVGSGTLTIDSTTGVDMNGISGDINYTATDGYNGTLVVSQ